jgi:hypothetical protein
MACRCSRRYLSALKSVSCPHLIVAGIRCEELKPTLDGLDGTPAPGLDQGGW